MRGDGWQAVKVADAAVMRAAAQQATEHLFPAFLGVARIVIIGGLEEEPRRQACLDQKLITHAALYRTEQHSCVDSQPFTTLVPEVFYAARISPIRGLLRRIIWKTSGTRVAFYVLVKLFKQVPVLRHAQNKIVPVFGEQ